MKYAEAFKAFNTDHTVGILVKTKDGNRLMSDYNFVGGTCACCLGCDSDDNLEVLRVIDVNTMEVLYEASEL